MISFNTVNPPGQERDCAEYLAKLLEDGGYKVTLYEFSERRTSLIAQIGSYVTKLQCVSLDTWIPYLLGAIVGRRTLSVEKLMGTKCLGEDLLI